MLIRNKSQSGFTLIELLVVISIIGLMASVALVAVNGARVKARDAKRKADLAQIIKAMELYYSNNPTNGYTIPTTGWTSVPGNASLACGCGWLNYQDGGAYVNSVASGLVQAGIVASVAYDPLLSSPNALLYNGRYQAYMLYPCGTTGVYAYTSLENPTPADSVLYTNSKNVGCANLDVFNINYAAGHN